MTDNEIIKALEEWLEKMRNSYLTSLDLGEYVTATNIEKNMCLLRETIDIINRQKAEIDDLKRNALPRCKDVLRRANEMGMALEKENKELQDLIVKYNGDFAKQEAEIERLLQKTQRPQDADPMDFCGVLCDFAEGLIAKAKAEAYKEFADRLKERPTADKDVQYVFELKIDKLLKELVGDADAS